VSALRPAGITEFHGRRIDTLSEGDMIDAGQWVKCVDVKAGKVIVRAVERPPELGDLNADDLKVGE
jgi:membrane-bound serine protease (ClpP class)